MLSEQEKLQVLLPHWQEHNTEHAAEFRAWAEKAGPARQELLAAAEHLEAANQALQAALEKLGGPLPAEHHH